MPELCCARCAVYHDPAGAIRTWCLATHANKFFASECQAAACSEPLWATSLSLLALLANAQGDLSPTSPALADVGELRDASGARAEAQATGSRAVRLSPRAALRTVTAVDAVAQLAWVRWLPGLTNTQVSLCL